MDIKSVKGSNVLLLGLLLNFILTFGLLVFTCFSLHRLDSRIATVERNLLVINHPYGLANRVIKPTSTHSRPSASQMKEHVVKRAVDSPSLCRICSSVCFKNSNGHRNVSCSLLYVIISVLGSVPNN